MKIIFTNELQLFLQKRKRGTYNNLELKLWVIEQQRVNKNGTNRQLSLDFSENFGPSISQSAICRILDNKEETLKMAKADTELNKNRPRKLYYTICIGERSRIRS